MAILARSIGIPARVVTGYAPGNYDTKLHQQIVRGTDAHSWTQVYFADYGWVNFEPTPGTPTFNHGNVASPERQNIVRLYESNAASGFYQVLGTIIGGMTLVVLLLCLLCLPSWQYFQSRMRTQDLFRRVCLLATWAGCAPHSSQTPYEYIQRLLLVMPQATEPLERLCDLYVREQWAHPASAEHPRSAGEWQEVPDLWMQMRPQLVKAQAAGHELRGAAVAVKD